MYMRWACSGASRIAPLRLGLCGRSSPDSNLQRATALVAVLGLTTALPGLL